MYLQDSGMREQNMHYLRRKAPSVRLLRELYLEEFKRSACHWPEGSFKLRAQFVCCKWRFFEPWAAPLFSGTRLSCTKDRKIRSHSEMHKYRHVSTHVSAHTHSRTLHCFGVGCLKLSWHPIRPSFPWSFLWSKSDLNWLRRISGLSK